MGDELPDWNDPKETKAWYEREAFESEYGGGLDDRIAYLDELWQKRREAEARILVACYIDGFGRWLYDGDPDGSLRTFVRILEEHSGDELFSRISVNRLCDQIRKLGANRKKKERDGKDALASRVERGLPTLKGILCRQTEILSSAVALLSAPDSTFVEKHIWRGTVASAVYEFFRNKAVHELGARGLTLASETLDGKPGPDVDFPRLHKALENIAKETKRIKLDEAKR